MRPLHMMKILKKEGLFYEGRPVNRHAAQRPLGKYLLQHALSCRRGGKGLAARGISDEKNLERGPGGDRKKPGDDLPRPTRAATDIWERGNRELLMEIFARTLTKAPTAKALVYTLAEYVKPSLDYRCFSEPRSGQYGLLVRLDCEPVAMTAPFSANRADVEKLAAQLTVQQRPLAEFRLQFLSGEIPGVLPEQTGEWTRQDDEA